MKKFFLILLAALSAYLVATLFFNLSKKRSIDTIKLSDRDHKDVIIEYVLGMELPVTDTIVSEEANKFSEQATQKVHEGNYEEAINITLSGLKKFPRSFLLQSDLASLFGDCSEITQAPLKDRMVQRAKQMFDRLMQEVNGQSKAAVYDFKNEYYYRFAKYCEQYELGLAKVLDYWGTDEWDSVGYRGYYSQGVGAANYARKLLVEGDKAGALDYAQKAIVAWAQYFSYRNDYYNAYVHYALALGLLGYKEEMMRALKRSASFIKRDLDYFEFKEVIDFVEGIEKK